MTSFGQAPAGVLGIRSDLLDLHQAWHLGFLEQGELLEGLSFLFAGSGSRLPIGGLKQVENHVMGNVHQLPRGTIQSLSGFPILSP